LLQNGSDYYATGLYLTGNSVGYIVTSPLDNIDIQSQLWFQQPN